jgi:hypothetical protein
VEDSVTDLKAMLFPSRLRSPVNDSDGLSNFVGLVLWKEDPLQLLNVVVSSFEVSLERRDTVLVLSGIQSLHAVKK